MASGGPGGGNEPPGRGTDAATSWHGCRLVAAVPAAWVVPVLGCNRLCELRRCCLARSLDLPSGRQAGAGSDGAGPDISIRASPIRYGQPSRTVACPLG